ncbi:serine protease [Niveibacterium sp. 24ML]|uniref:S1C family serine protease n=1 Tax=Niveibacterium sp. 24ML TaxID=2985512 RepID=UPI002270C045|nr:serine protease [Niveibacterium sp. 24ML]MCX9156921.1 serine protease [Niveibacterium sp. 24ML]
MPNSSRLRRSWRHASRALGFALALLAAVPAAAELADTILKVKPSIVAVGTYQRARTPPFRLLGTGFAVGDGSLVATNSHVVPATLDAERFEELIVFAFGEGGEPKPFRATKRGSDPTHDLALLKLEGVVLPALRLEESLRVREGQAIAFTGFPIVGALGLSPATHRGIVSAITPNVRPTAQGGQLNPQAIKRIREGSFPVLQLDATAYPGNSGSPVFDQESGNVLAVVNMVFVKGSKESALSQPSGITYAIPAHFLKALIDQAR